MDKKLYKDAEMKLEREIREINDKQGFTAQDLEIMYKVLDNLKDISIICAMKKEEEEGYSERGSYGYDDDSYARGRGRYAQRDSMGRYSSRGSYEGDSYDGMSNRGSYDDSYERGYSSHGELDKMMQDAKSEKERDLIRQLKQMKER